MSDSIFIGIADFENPTILFISNSGGYVSLSESLQSYMPVKLRINASHIETGISTLVLATHDKPSVLVQEGSSIICRLSKSALNDACSKLLNLSKVVSSAGAHQFIDVDNNATDFELVASINEYNPEKLFRKN